MSSLEPIKIHLGQLRYAYGIDIKIAEEVLHNIGGVFNGRVANSSMSSLNGKTYSRETIEEFFKGLSSYKEIFYDDNIFAILKEAQKYSGDIIYEKINLFNKYHPHQLLLWAIIDLCIVDRDEAIFCLFTEHDKKNILHDTDFISNKIINSVLDSRLSCGHIPPAVYRKYSWVRDGLIPNSNGKNLSQKEKRTFLICLDIAKGMSNVDISTKYSISISTIVRAKAEVDTLFKQYGLPSIKQYFPEYRIKRETPRS